MPTSPSQPMVADRSRGSSRPPALLLVLLFAAVAIGVAATYLASPADPFHETPSTSPAFGPSLPVIAESVFVLFVLLLIFLAIYRIAAGGQRGQGRAVLSILYVFLVSIVFLIAAHYAITSGNPTELVGNQTGTGSGGTTPPPPPGNVSNRTLPAPGPLPIAPSIPGWITYAILGVVAVLLALYLTPYLLARGKPEGAEGSAASRVERSLEHALRALEPGADADPRATVIALYARLLQELGPYLEHLESATPREIEGESVARFGLQPENARALTRLFEEARYSSHPFTDYEVVQARGALATALSDLKAVKTRS